ncbi:hypothetical protein QQ045_009479 [Rhodiola kirilowii]
MAWNRFNTPRDALHTVVVAQDKLLTKNRLRNMGLNVSAGCVLCEEEDETRDHLFFECKVSQAILCEVLSFLKSPRAPVNWHLLIPWYKKQNQRKLQTMMVAAGLTTTMGEIWKVRNAIIFRQEVIHHQHVIGPTIWRLKMKLALKSKYFGLDDRSWLRSMGFDL